MNQILSPITNDSGAGYGSAHTESSDGAASDKATSGTRTDKSTRPRKPRLPERLGKKLMSRFNARLRIGAPFRKVPEGLHRVANQLALSIELLEDFKAGHYREIPWGSIAILSGALLYAVSPADVLPDALLGLGQMDDAIVLAVATRLVRPQLQAYCQFKGYKLSDYFGPLPTAPQNKRPAPAVNVQAADIPA